MKYLVAFLRHLRIFTILKAAFALLSTPRLRFGRWLHDRATNLISKLEGGKLENEELNNLFASSDLLGHCCFCGVSNRSGR
jgi:hypothetical protein